LPVFLAPLIMSRSDLDMIRGGLFVCEYIR
jgi:hypothetical protein